MYVIDSINQIAPAWADFMVSRSLDAALVFLLAGALWLLVRRRVPVWVGYWLFLLVFAKLLVPAPVAIQGLIAQWFPAAEIRTGDPGLGDLAGIDGFSGKAAESGDAAAETAGAQPDALPPLGAPAVLIWIWMAGAAAMLSRQAWLERKTRLIIRDTVPFDPRSLPLDLDELRAAAGVKREVRWVTGRWARSPVACGYFRPAVAVPADIAHHYTVRQLRWVLLHELAHIKRLDAFVFLFQRFALSLFFFHPFAWWANALIGELREYACDDDALEGSRSTPKECGEGFLGAVLRCNGLPAFSFASHGLINYNTAVRKRLTRILEASALDRRITTVAKVPFIAFALFALAVDWSADAAGAGVWIMTAGDPQQDPGPRCLHNMCYDSDREVVVLHGGFHRGTLKDTWEFDVNANKWEPVSIWGPPNMFGYMVYDPSRKVSVLSGSFDDHCQTWEWDGEFWDLKYEETRLMGVAMAYHPDRKTVIRHGGIPAWNLEEVVWESTTKTAEWDGRDWRPLPDGPLLGDHKMVYDQRRGVMVVFGGIADYASASGETWEFGGEEWTKVSDTGPEPRQGFDMVYDPVREVTLLMGGGLTGYSFHDSNRHYNGIWQWDGAEWTKLDIAPPTGHNIWHRMAYDAKNRQIVLFGGVELYQGMDQALDIYRPNDVWFLRFAQGGAFLNNWRVY